MDHSDYGSGHAWFHPSFTPCSHQPPRHHHGSSCCCQHKRVGCREQFMLSRQNSAIQTLEVACSIAWMPVDIQIKTTSPCTQQAQTRVHTTSPFQSGIAPYPAQHCSHKPASPYHATGRYTCATRGRDCQAHARAPCAARRAAMHAAGPDVGTPYTNEPACKLGVRGTDQLDRVLPSPARSPASASTSQGPHRRSNGAHPLDMWIRAAVQ